MPLMGGLAIGGGLLAGGLMNYFGTQQAAGAAQNAAQAQAAQAAANRSQTLSMLGNGQSATSLAAATPQELNILGEQYSAASQNLQRQQQLMASINPSLMEASKQALALLQGGTAASTSGIMSMRGQQRQQLINSLQSQYGPGAESTSIGQQQLMQFDQQTQMMQNGMMNNLFNIAGSGAPQANLLQGMTGLQSVGAGYSALQNRQLNTQLAGIGDIAGVQNQMLQTAGAPYAGAALQGQGMASLGNNLMGGALQMGSSYAMGYGNGMGRMAGGGVPGISSPY